MDRAIRLHYERVVVVALLLGVVLPLYFLLTGFAVAGPNESVVRCASTVVALGNSGTTTAGPNGACHAGAVQRLHLAVGYLAACLAVAFIVWLVAGARERALNRAWTDDRLAQRRINTPTDVWIFAALLFVVFAGAAQAF